MLFPGAINYIVFVFASDGTLISKIETDQSFANVNVLEPGKAYEVSLQSIGPRGDKSIKNSKSTHIKTLLPAPIGLTVAQVDSMSIALEWEPVDGNEK